MISGGDKLSIKINCVAEQKVNTVEWQEEGLLPGRPFQGEQVQRPWG